MTEETQPWDRQRDEYGEVERNLWYDRFTRYRLMGSSRTLTEACNLWRDRRGRDRSGNVPNSWRRAYARWRWKERAEAWDQHQRERLIAEQEEARAAMVERHIRLGMAMESVGARKIQELGRNPAGLNAAEARHYIRDGVDIERQARGMDDRWRGPETVQTVIVKLELPEKGSGWEILEDDVVDGRAIELEGPAGSPAEVPKLPG